MVQRYTPDYVMHAARFAPFARESEHGEFVKFSDYEALLSELASSRQINAQTLLVKLKMAETIKELTDRVNALAVENAALKVAVDGFNQELYGKGFEVLGWHLNGDTEPLDNWFGENDWNPETPATDAALAAIREQACKALIDAFVRQVDAAGLDDSDSVTIFECRDTMKYAAEQAINPREAK
ncbi:TPA: hypothetical protein U2J86_004728 [Serratia marcescens]|nr:hypothetical protein [Serratia marcescens]